MEPLHTVGGNVIYADTIKLLEENIGRTLYDIHHSKIFLTQKNMGNKNKNKQMEPNEI